MNNLNIFKKTFGWYRNLTIELLKQLPEDRMDDQISSRSIPIRCQLIDLGDMQLKIVGLMGAKHMGTFKRPSETTGSKDEIISYLNESHKAVLKALEGMNPQTASLDWFGRMHFEFDEALAFMLAHEAMHHGEILSFIFAKDLPMPNAFKDTWGFER